MKISIVTEGLEIIRTESMKQLRGGYYETDGQPIGETKGDPPPMI